MRITSTMQNRNFLETIEQVKTRLDKSQQEISTGKRVSKLSDDPFAAAQSSELGAVIGANDRLIDGNDQLRGKLELTDYVLQALNDTTDSAKTLAAQALSGTTTPESRQALATAVGGIREQALAAANTQYNGSYLFAGTQTVVPFVDSGGIVTYQGDDEAVYHRLDRSAVIQTNITGQDLFEGPPAVFATLSGLQTAILANDTTAIQARLDDLNTISNRVNTRAAVVGNNMQLLDQLQARLKDQTLALEKENADLTDADLVKSITNVNLNSQALNVAMSAQAQVQQLSLIDFLR